MGDYLVAQMVRNLPQMKERDPGSIPESGRFPGEGNGYPFPVFLPGEFHGKRSLASDSPWGQKRWT